MVDEVKNPSEGSTAAQVEKASSVFASLEAEEDLVPISSGGGRKLFAGTGTVSTPASKAKAKPKAKSMQPVVYAAKQRAKTTKDFMEAERCLQKAQEVGVKVLREIAPKVLPDPGDVEQDPSLQLLKARLQLVELASHSAQEPEISQVQSQRLYQEAIKDPYLKDLQMTIFSDPISAQTMGALNYGRRVVLDL